MISFTGKLIVCEISCRNPRQTIKIDDIPHEISIHEKDKFYLYAIAKFINHTRRSED